MLDIPFADDKYTTFVMRTNVNMIHMHDLLEQFLIQIREHDPSAKIMAVQLTSEGETERIVNNLSELTDDHLKMYEDMEDETNGEESG